MGTVTVKINGTDYPLKGEENERYLIKVASYVDRKVRKLMENNSSLSTASASILAAINVVDDMFKLQEAYNELSEKLDKLQTSEKELKEQVVSLADGKLLKDYKEQIERMQKELEFTQESAKSYIEENKRLQADNKEIKFQLQTAKYKLIDLQNKLIDNQIDLVKTKKSKNIPMK